MQNNEHIKTDDRLTLIQEQLLKYVKLDFGCSLPVSDKGDDIDAIIIGLNTLGEELNGIVKIKGN